jgi:UDP-3-O-[3-hydroxymyristoyl] glucosamine N-acyltransferase
VTETAFLIRTTHLASVANALTLGELVEWTGGEILRGNPDAIFLGIASLDVATPDDVSFLGNPKYHAQFTTTRAGAVIVPKGVTDAPESTALIAVDNPSLAFAALVKHFAARVAAFTPGMDDTAWIDPTASINPATCRVHPGAVIQAGAVIGDGCEIGPNAVIGEFTRLGRDCRIMANAVVRERCTLGDRVILQPGAVIGSDGYGYELVDGRHVKIDQVGIVELHDDVEVGANSTIDRARFGKTVIGEGTKIDNLVQIGHNCIVGKHCLIVSQCGLAGSTVIGDYVTIAAQSGTAGHLKIGDHAILAARTGATKSLPGGRIYSGKPAVPIKEDTRNQACVRRLPELIDRIIALEKSAKKGDPKAP